MSLRKERSMYIISVGIHKIFEVRVNHIFGTITKLCKKFITKIAW